MAISARPSPVKDTRTQLFVGNLPYRVRWQDLKDLFRRAGTVLRADVSLGADNRSRGYGTVLLATAEDAGRAIDMFNGYSWQTRILEVRHDRLPPTDFDTTISSLPPLGSSTNAALLSRPSVLHQGSHYPSIDEVSDVHGLFNQYQSHDGVLSSASGSASQGRNLFVGNLPFHCQWQDLKDLFRQAGTIIRADVALGPDGRSRGFGTVVFSNEYDAERALRMFDGYEYNGRPLKVHYDKFSALAQSNMLSSPTPPVLTPQIQLSAPHPRPPPSRLRLPHSPLSQSHQERAEPSPYDVYLAEQSLFAQHQQQQAQLQRHLSSLEPPKPTPLQRSSRSGSSNNSSASNSGGSVPTTFDMESIASSLSSVTSYSGPSASSNSQPPGLQLPRSSEKSAASHKKMTQPRPSSPTRTNSHPRHPGTITLPPPPPLPAFPLSPTHSIGHITPMHSPHHPPSHPQYQFTPHGLPPMTPSMPAFYFPQPSPHGGPMYYQVQTPTGIATMAYGHPIHASSTPMATPPIHPGFMPLPTPPVHMGPGGVFSPMSPGLFWAGGTVNPAINPTVGAPVMKEASSETAEGYEQVNSGDSYRRSEGTGYFDMPLQDYFPFVPPADSANSSEPFVSPEEVPSGESGTTSLVENRPQQGRSRTQDDAPEDTAKTLIAAARTHSMSEHTKPTMPSSMRRNDSDP
jgi:RNA recognition motif-containing protein